MTIKHLSPSSLCLFRSQPSIWVLKYLMGAKDEAGPAAWRGSAVEAGLDSYLFGQPDHWERAANRFELDAQGDAADHVQKQRDLVKPILSQACSGAYSYRAPLAHQFPIEYRFGGAIEWPIKGYVDYLYESHLFDLKTTERLPSEPKPDHVLQCSIYAEATKRPARLLYCTPKKYAWHDVTPEMQAAGLEEARRIAHNIAAMLRLSTDPRKLLQVFPMDPDNFRWSDNLRQLYLQEQAA